MLTIYYSDQYLLPLPAGHKFPARKYRLVRSLLEFHPAFDPRPAPLAEPEHLALAHDPAYVRAVIQGSVDPRIMRRIGFPWSEELVRRSLASVGGTLAAARDAMRTGFGGNLAGGTHHAFRSEGSGFCVFNDLAVAIHVLRREGLAQRAAVVDLDVHQGDGTASIFEQDPDVLTLSIHGENNFPFRKQTSRIDLGLPDGTGDAAYLDQLRSVLPRVAEFRPQIVFYQAGVDGLGGDRLGRLALTPGGLIERDRAVFTLMKDCGIPVAVTLGGGYCEPIEPTVEAHANCFRIAAAVLRDF
ncbi:MAG TPA: histone deacetylase [Candidatus Acidoferrales bacterium]|nr:histone deacetylase [Candidatus Acidoferrales bacterium]